MIRYRPVSIKMWGDDRFRTLSKPNPNGQTLWIYLLTGPHTSPLPGAFVAGEASLAEALNWPLQAFRKAFTEILGCGLGKFDRSTRLVFLPKAVIHNPPQSVNVVKGWRKAFNELPDCYLKEEVFSTTLANLKSLEGLSEAYFEAFGQAFRYANGKAIVYPEPEPEPEPEQEGSPLRKRVPSFKISRSIEGANERAKKQDERASENDPADPEFRKRLWAPIEKNLRKETDPEYFARYYDGIEIKALTGTAVTLAVPEPLITKYGGNCELTGKILQNRIEGQPFDLLKGRHLIVEHLS